MWNYSRVSTPLKFSIATPPAVEPVTYSDLSQWLKLPSFDDQGLTNTLEIIGRMYIEGRSRYTMITTTFNLYLDYFPQEIFLPARPVQRVNSITYTDQNNVVQTLDPSRYEVDIQGPRPRIIPPLSNFFPIAKVQYPNAVVVNFTAGFGDTGATVPEPYKLMIQQWVALNYNQREAVATNRTPAIIPHTFEHLLRLNSLPEV
jgi:uncharacterized phiE125 gp8 family phage protein